MKQITDPDLATAIRVVDALRQKSPDELAYFATHHALIAEQERRAGTIGDGPAMDEGIKLPEAPYR